MNKFWIVIRDKPDGTFVSKRHPTYAEALAEACRLARKEDCRFLIAEVISSVEPDTRPLIIKTLLEAGKDIPF